MKENNEKIIQKLQDLVVSLQELGTINYKLVSYRYSKGKHSVKIET